jgi:hypothetical protein
MQSRTMLAPGNYQQLSLDTPATYKTHTISHQTQEIQGSVSPDGNINLHLRAEGKNQWRLTQLTRYHEALGHLYPYHPSIRFLGDVFQ